MFSKSYKIATIAGIPLQLHWSFGLLVFWILYVGMSTGLDLAGMGVLSLFVLCLFTCVVLHEFGHALTARRFGVETRDIILSPIGGVARLNRLPDKPIQEFWVAIAGPMVNVVIVILLGVYFYFFSSQSLIPQVGDAGEIFGSISYVLPLLFWINIMLIVFNLIPAFPMDGGRVLRSLLAMRLGHNRATKIAAYIGRAIAVVFVIAGIFSNWTLILIGIFVFITAGREYQMTRINERLNDGSAADVMRPVYMRVYQHQPISVAMDILKRGGESAGLLVFDESDRLVGVLHELFVVDAMKKGEGERPIAGFVSQNYERIAPSDSLRSVHERMAREGYSIVPVMDEDRNLLGAIDIYAMNNYMRLQRRLS